MTEQDFVNRWKAELDGIALDGMVSRPGGAELALAVRAMMARHVAILRKIYHDSQPQTPAAKPHETNGTSQRSLK